MTTQKFLRSVLTAMAAAAMFAGSAPLMAQDENTKTEKASKRHSYFFHGFKLVESPSGLLGDMTKRSLGLGWTFGNRLFFPEVDKWALQLKWDYEYWGERHFQGADNEKISVHDVEFAIGLAYFLGSKPWTEDRCYFSFDIGGAFTLVRPQSHEKRRWADSGTAALKFGYGGRDGFIEAGVEGKFINANEMGYMGYNRFSHTFVLTIGLGAW
jgi:hypothetical protein